MWFQIKAYFQFLWRSTNQHGVHSPFVYSLVTKCFYDKRNYPSYGSWKKAQQSLLQDTSTIQMSDAGAGSRVFSSNQRKVASIAKNAGTKFKRAKLLNRLVRYFEVNEGLELGTSLGLGSLAMRLDNEVAISSVEACPNTLARAKQLFQEFDAKEIQTFNAKFDTFFEKLPTYKKFDLVFLDGHHQGEATLNYVEKILPHLHDDSLLILDDIHWSEDMQDAWNQLANDSRVSVSIDTFFWGFLFFRKGQVKEHFVIRV